MDENYSSANVSTLRMERLKRGLSLMDVSQIVGVAPATLAGWELGNRIPTIDNAIILSRYYDVPIKELFKEFFVHLNLKSN